MLLLLLLLLLVLLLLLLLFKDTNTEAPNYLQFCKIMDQKLHNGYFFTHIQLTTTTTISEQTTAAAAEEGNRGNIAEGLASGPVVPLIQTKSQNYTSDLLHVSVFNVEIKLLFVRFSSFFKVPSYAIIKNNYFLALKYYIGNLYIFKIFLFQPPLLSPSLPVQKNSRHNNRSKNTLQAVKTKFSDSQEQSETILVKKLKQLWILFPLVLPVFLLGCFLCIKKQLK